MTTDTRERARERAWQHSCRARAARYHVPYEPVTRAAIYAAGGGRCWLCGRQVALAEMEGDHAIPLAAGGWNVPSNLRCACRTCNRSRGARTRPLDAPHPALLAALSAVFARAGISVSVHAIRPAPGLWTVLYVVDPLDMPRAVRLDGEASAAIGARAPLRAFRAGPWLAVQVPRARPLPVLLRHMQAHGPRVEVGIGAAGQRVSINLAARGQAHVFVAGASDTGKSELLRALVAGLARGNAPGKIRLLLADTKRQTFTGPLARLPHCEHPPARTPDECRAMVGLAQAELRRRIDSTPDGRRWTPDGPPVVLVLDELQDIGDPNALMAIARQGRAFSVHLVVATQVHRRAEIDSRVAGQFGVRCCFRVNPSDTYTSQAMLGTNDAQYLTGAGDALFRMGPRLLRVAVAYEPPNSHFWSDGWMEAEHRPIPAGGNDAAPRGRQLSAEAREWITSQAKPPGINSIARKFGIGNSTAARWRQEATAT